MSDAPAQALHIGCADLPPGLSRRRYFERLGYLETTATLLGIPRRAVLRGWREEAAGPGRFGLIAPQIITHRPGRKGYRRSKVTLSPAELAQAGAFRATEVVAQATEALAQAAEVIAASVIVFRSPPDFAPSAANRDAMRRYFDEQAPAARFAGALRVWEPQGLWEPQVAARFAGELGLVLACDPLTNDPIGVDPDFFSNLPGDDAYFRVTGLGQARRRLDDYALEPLLEAAEAYQRAWLVFAHEGKYPDAIRLRRQIEGEPAENPTPAEAESLDD
ncbi:DUF72 domain-containing protein [Haliangium sp.]|uniref:DUF72 domain-containing protein n=1 Tax=Haliangium sp. TaxID=2663208 RepID=UPI003D0B9834